MSFHMQRVSTFPRPHQQRQQQQQQSIATLRKLKLKPRTPKSWRGEWKLPKKKRQFSWKIMLRWLYFFWERWCTWHNLCGKFKNRKCKPRLEKPEQTKQSQKPDLWIPIRIRSGAKWGNLVMGRVAGLVNHGMLHTNVTQLPVTQLGWDEHETNCNLLNCKIASATATQAK